MESTKQNKALKISLEIYGLFKLIANKILSNKNQLMDKHQIDEIYKNGYLDGEIMPYAFIFSPNEDKNTIANLKLNSYVNLKLDNKIVGRIFVKSVFKFQKEWKNISIFWANSAQFMSANIDENALCISGEIEIFDDDIKNIKEQISNKIKELNAKKITALMMCANPFHRVHERLVRMAIDKADLLIIFLIRSLREDRLDYELRLKTIKHFIKNFLPNQIVAVVPLRDTTLFTAHNNPELEAIAAYKFGATKIVIGQNHGAIGMFFDENQPFTIFDRVKNALNLDVLVMPEYVFCNECKAIVSTKTCPHGQHHHIKFHSPTIRTLLRKGIMPPEILMRKELSSMILSELFPNRFENLQQIYDELFPNKGLLEIHSYEEFYKELANLYQMNL
ncbi:sulfate adenylyltransferase [Campylobacter sp. FMV-PI01]|uniref:Sulfate adenylyltransferase n=1 Tax=Campylobacter portucalensis TaxID=2608384 RepID=A0A6L5WKY1_9BACT|nr:sulfate adenylyltransferase [Campylobacter portucalensis]MSN96391.1 sulfate adenylyltransferase [Campylobacter portucalensis]